ncbi:MAG: hypothetical protein COW44_10570 [Flavobacteriaceae bacterium CG17_big_fil_post_rev_8_21_14_2_50_33_15]|nr:MAG: hypothetical protein COW44_10570 [Flavobacteriaceae bacterium CG17_big_fil_post_rev_8_21_14_2_50_33_15]
MRGLALNFASTHQAENPRGFSEVGENKQLLIAIVVVRYYIFSSSIRSNILSLSKSILFFS